MSVRIYWYNFGRGVVLRMHNELGVSRSGRRNFLLDLVRWRIFYELIVSGHRLSLCCKMQPYKETQSNQIFSQARPKFQRHRNSSTLKMATLTPSHGKNPAPQLCTSSPSTQSPVEFLNSLTNRFHPLIPHIHHIQVHDCMYFRQCVDPLQAIGIILGFRFPKKCLGCWWKSLIGCYAAAM